MHTYTVFLPNEYDELAVIIADIAKEKNQSISTVVRDMLCELNNFEPVRFREIKNVKRRRDKKDQDEKK